MVYFFLSFFFCCCWGATKVLCELFFWLKFKISFFFLITDLYFKCWRDGILLLSSNWPILTPFEKIFMIIQNYRGILDTNPSQVTLVHKFCNAFSRYWQTFSTLWQYLDAGMYCLVEFSIFLLSGTGPYGSWNMILTAL